MNSAGTKERSLEDDWDHKIYIEKTAVSYQVWYQLSESDHSCPWLHSDMFHLRIQWSPEL